MNKAETYVIPLKGPGEGDDRYDLKVDDSFFGTFPYSPVKGGQAEVRVSVTRSPACVRFDVAVAGQVVAECDRCLGDCLLPVDFHGEFSVRFHENEQDFDGDIWWLAEGTEEIDISHYIYESILLSLPLRRVHENPSLCDPAVADYITEGSAQQAATDSRWEKLREIKEELTETE